MFTRESKGIAWNVLKCDKYGCYITDAVMVEGIPSRDPKSGNIRQG